MPIDDDDGGDADGGGGGTAWSQPPVDTGELTTQAAADGRTGAVWKLGDPRRDIDANVIRLEGGGRIDRHVGPDLDVVVHAISGSGELVTDQGTTSLTPGTLVWLAAGSVREFRAGADGLCYLSAHRRRHDALRISPRPGA